MTCIRCTTPRECDIWGCVPGTFPPERNLSRGSSTRAVVVQFGASIGKTEQLADSTFAELETQARRLRREALNENRGLPDFVVTPGELDELRRANYSQFPAGKESGWVFYGMKIRVVYP